MYPNYEEKRNQATLSATNALQWGRHLHRHVELVVVLSGETVVALDTVKYHLRAGDAFLVFPNQVHFYEKVGEERSFLSIFPPDFCQDFLDIFLHGEISQPVVRDFLTPQLRDFCEHMLQWDQNNRFFNARLRGGLGILLSRFFERMPAQRNLRRETDVLKSILSYCVQNYASDLSLDDLAHDLHISKFHISHLINGKLKMSFNEYLHTIRISAALPLLLQGEKTVTEISHQVGYNSIRTFNRAFLQQTGMTPRDYRNATGLDPASGASLAYASLHPLPQKQKIEENI